MKNIFFVLLLFIGALSMTVISCNEDILPDNGEGNEGNGVRTVKIGVQIESGTKVTLSNDNKFGWVEGDAIAIWTGASNSSGSFQSCTVSSNSIEVFLGEGESLHNYAIYPASVKDDLNYGQSTLNVILPASYAYSDISGNNTPLPMVAANTAGNLVFYNVGGLLRLTVSSIPADATGLYIQFPGRKVNGTFPVSNPGTNTSTISTGVPGSGEDKITVNFDAGTATEMTLNIPLPTGIYEDVLIIPVGSSTKSVAFQSIISNDTYEVKRAHGKKLTAPMTGGFDLTNNSFNNSEVSYAYIYQSNAAATSNTITIADGQKVLLGGVNMLVSGNAIDCLGDAEIVLSGTNTVNSQYSSSGDNNKAIIKAGTYDPMTTLTIGGSGTLEVRTKYTGSWMGALIGSDKNGDCGNITITGGAITAIAYPKQGASEYNNTAAYGACIGAGSSYSGTSRCGDITISGGTVTVDTHKGGGAGIGSGCSENSSGYSTCGTITISGGKVTAQSWEGGAAIGSGREGFTTNATWNGYSRCEGIVIEGTAAVTATSTANNSSTTNAYAGAAIGAGHCAQVGAITISGGTVTAKMSDYYAPGIGSGKSRSTCGNITIKGGTVEATGGQKAAGIGTGYGAYKLVSTCGTITITTGVTKVKATMGYQGKHSIGAGGYYNNANQVSCGTVTIGGTTGQISTSPYTYQP